MTAPPETAAEAPPGAEVEVLPRAALALCDVPIDLDQRIRLADTISRAGILPKHLRGNSGNVLAICFAAHALQIPLWPAMQEMTCIEGKVGLSANLMRGLWLRAGHRFRVTERTPEAATVEVTRRGEEPYTVRWTIEDALAAGLCSRDAEGWIRARDKENRPLPWERYTTAMLVARATSAALRESGADILMGFGYTAEELSGGVYMDGAAVHVVTSLAETEEQAAERVASMQRKYDACVAEIEAAPDEAALRGLWKAYNDLGIVRVEVPGRDGTLEQVIIRVRERREGEPPRDVPAEAPDPAAGEDAPAAASPAPDDGAIEGKVMGKTKAADTHPSEGPADASGDEVFR